MMTAQPTLFDLPPVAIDPPAVHTNDPMTSYEALRKHEAQGKRGRHQSLVLRLIRDHPGLTACELWEVASDAIRAELHELQEVRRRCTDLLARGEIVQGAPRHCRVRGSRQVTWIVAGGE